MCTLRQMTPTASLRYVIATLLCTRTHIWGTSDPSRGLRESSKTDCTPRVRRVKAPVGQNGASGRRFVALRMLGCECLFTRFEPLLTRRRRPDDFYVTTPIPHWAFMNVTVRARIGA